MKFHEKAKRNLFRFIDGISRECSITEIRGYIVSMTKYHDFDSYFDNVIESISPNSEDRDVKRRYCRVQSDLAIVSGLYYGRNLSLKHLEQDYELNISREQLKQEVVRVTSHILFGREASSVDQVGDIQIEREGLIPIMDRIISSGMTEQEQKNELMSYLRVYGILSARDMQEAREAADKDPDVILARNTYQNRTAALTATSFVERVGGSNHAAGKNISFSV